MLNLDQEKGKQFFMNWWQGSQAYSILQSPAGFGKTFMLLDLLEALPNCTPIVTAPTNEAVRQLKNRIKTKYELKTTYSAAGYGFDSTSEVEVLKQVRNPTAELENFNLMVVDEASFIGDDLLNSLKELNIRIIFSGHASQLPEVKPNLSVTDKCESPVFKEDFPKYSLSTPVRNIGDIYLFCEYLESLIYTDKPRVVKPGQFARTIQYMTDYIHDKALLEFLPGNTKLLAWTNSMADLLNTSVRKCIFQTNTPAPYYIGDNIILTEPSYYVGRADLGTEFKLQQLKNKAYRFTANSNFIVQAIRECEVLKVPCWALKVIEDGNDMELFIPKDNKDYIALCKHYIHLSYHCKTMEARRKSFERYNYLKRLFSHVKYSYALTVHRSQGMSIPNVFVFYYDIAKCANPYLKHKLLYVAASRAMDNLGIVVK